MGAGGARSLGRRRPRSTRSGLRTEGTDRRKGLTGPGDESPTAWSASGGILFTRVEFAGANVYAMRLGRSHIRELTCATGDERAATWSPDGSHIVCVIGGYGAGQLAVMNADGSDQHVITASNLNAFDPSWGP